LEAQLGLEIASQPSPVTPDPHEDVPNRMIQGGIELIVAGA
jgi:hypothetical protein